MKGHVCHMISKILVLYQSVALTRCQIVNPDRELSPTTENPLPGFGDYQEMLFRQVQNRANFTFARSWHDRSQPSIRSHESVLGFSPETARRMAEHLLALGHPYCAFKVTQLRELVQRLQRFRSGIIAEYP